MNNKNARIAVFMGLELMTDSEKVAYTTSRQVDDHEAFCKRINNLPDLKKKGAVITTISHNDVTYSDILNYENSIDALLPVIEKIKNILKKGIEARNNRYAINYLLGSGYKFKSKVYLHEVDFTVENLYNRIVMFVDFYQK